MNAKLEAFLRLNIVKKEKNSLTLKFVYMMEHYLNMQRLGDHTDSVTYGDMCAK